MRTIMFFVWFFGGLILIALGVVFSVGAVLPRDHVATGSMVFPQPAGELFAAIRNVGAAPGWRKGLSKVEVHAGTPDRPDSWTEVSGHGAMKMVLEREEVNQTLVTRIDDDSLPFGGTWTFSLTTEANGTRLRITESGFVKSPPFRFISRFFMGHSSTLKQYLSDLAARNGLPARIEE